jgi:alpha-tubulin suppressor-like RCC1 family protein
VKSTPTRLARPIAVAGAATLCLTAALAPAAGATTTGPTITSLSGTSGPLGGHGKLTVHGSGFTNVKAVMFGGAKAGSVHVVSTHTLTLIVPAHKAARLDVRVVTGSAESPTSKHDVYTYVAAPAVSSVSTKSGSAGLKVTIKGTGFTHVKKVLFGKATGTHLHVASSKTLTVTAPAHTPGRVDIRVVSSYGTSAAKTTDRFTFTTPPAPPGPPTPPSPTTPVITTVSLPAVDRGRAYSAGVSVAGGTPPYALSATGLPTGITMSSTGALTGTTWAAVGRRPATVAVVDAVGHTASATVPVTVAVGAGQLYAWGANTNGQVGIGTTALVTLPVALPGMTDVVQVVGGGSAGYALRADGTVWSWGHNNYGQLGDGTATDHGTPQKISGLSNIVAVAAGTDSAYALKADGTVVAWGQDGFGDLGDGDTNNERSPVAVTGLTNVVQLSAAAEAAFAVTADGHVWSWGHNDYGKLGTGSAKTFVATATQVPGVTDARQVSTKLATVHVLLDDGTVLGWGRNDLGQVGDTSVTNRSTPVHVAGLTGVVQLADANLAGYALLSDGTLDAWGENVYGQLGSPAGIESLTAITVAGLTGVQSIAASDAGCFATLSDGSLSDWGVNLDAELGNGSTSDHASTPALNQALLGMTSVAAAYQTEYAIR